LQGILDPLQRRKSTTVAIELKIKVMSSRTEQVTPEYRPESCSSSFYLKEEIGHHGGEETPKENNSAYLAVLASPSNRPISKFTMITTSGDLMHPLTK
jgi:hypothetical protein